MKALLLLLVSVYITLANGLTYQVTMYESADVNNHGGIITSDETNIDYILVHEEYMQLQGTNKNGNPVGYYYELKDPTIVKVDNITYYKYLVVKDNVLYCLIFQMGKQLTVVNTEKDMIEVFTLESYNEF